MDDAFNLLFGRRLEDEEDPDKKTDKQSEFRATSGFNPSEPYYDPQLRLKQRLRMLFPHLPFIPGLPPKRDER